MEETFKRICPRCKIEKILSMDFFQKSNQTKTVFNVIAKYIEMK